MHERGSMCEHANLQDLRVMQNDSNAYLGDKMHEGGPMCNYAQLLDLIVKWLQMQCGCKNYLNEMQCMKDLNVIKTILQD